MAISRAMAAKAAKSRKGTTHKRKIVTSELTTDLISGNKTSKAVISSMWAISPKLAKEIENMNQVNSSPYGLFRSVPIICRADNCAFKSVCMVKKASRLKGQRCPMEISTILSRFEQWCNHFDVDIIDDTIDPKDLVDATLIKDLVIVEVQQLRVENKIALNGDFMGKTLLDIDKKCKAYYGDIVSPESEFLLTLQQRKEKILNQLNATRKDKAQDRRAETPSDEAMKLFQQVREMERKTINVQEYSVTDIEFDDDGNVIEVGEDTEEENTEQEEGESNDTEDIE